jgi:hypothetical protein
VFSIECVLYSMLHRVPQSIAGSTCMFSLECIFLQNVFSTNVAASSVWVQGLVP